MRGTALRGVAGMLVALVLLGGAAGLATSGLQDESPPDPFRVLRTLTRYEPAEDDRMRLVTETIVDEDGAGTYEHRLAPGSVADRVRAVDVASGEALEVDGGPQSVTVQLGRSLPPRAERRLRIVERVHDDAFVAAGGEVVFSREIPPGRVVVAFPGASAPAGSSVPAQWQVQDGRLEAGVVHVGRRPLPVTIRASTTASAAPDDLVEGDFRAEDERNIVYRVEDAVEGRFRLALELIIDNPGQSHAYSVLNKTDNITEPATLDVDRGIELPTRIVDGRTANGYGDAPTRFAPDASVFVADLGYAVPAGGSARVRLFQSAREPDGLRVLEDGRLRWDRFLARLRTRIVLPPRWHLTSADQPAYVRRDGEGRLVLDWVHTGGDRAPLVITARPSG